jgi:hypothetical protein
LCTQESDLLSDIVIRYKKRMNAAGFHVWNWSEVNRERTADEFDAGAAGDPFYGGVVGECELDENASLTEILAESFNVRAGAR